MMFIIVIPVLPNLGDKPFQTDLDYLSVLFSLSAFVLRVIFLYHSFVTE